MGSALIGPMHATSRQRIILSAAATLLFGACSSDNATERSQPDDSVTWAIAAAAQLDVPMPLPEIIAAGTAPPSEPTTDELENPNGVSGRRQPRASEPLADTTPPDPSAGPTVDTEPDETAATLDEETPALDPLPELPARPAN